MTPNVGILMNLSVLWTKPSIPEVSLPCSSLDTSFECNMMHCKSESCYSSHSHVKSGDFELADYDYDLDYDGIYNYPEYDDYYDTVCSPAQEPYLCQFSTNLEMVNCELGPTFGAKFQDMWKTS